MHSCGGRHSRRAPLLREYTHTKLNAHSRFLCTPTTRRTKTSETTPEAPQPSAVHRRLTWSKVSTEHCQPLHLELDAKLQHKAQLQKDRYHRIRAGTRVCPGARSRLSLRFHLAGCYINVGTSTLLRPLHRYAPYCFGLPAYRAGCLEAACPSAGASLLTGTSADSAAHDACRQDRPHARGRAHCIACCGDAVDRHSFDCTTPCSCSALPAFIPLLRSCPLLCVADARTVVKCTCKHSK